jgi:ubiquinone/menaquinone biosynthesis C-methylase UbiE
MPEKHYNATYLEDTARVMQNLKKRSYSLLETIKQGTIADLGCGIGKDVIAMAGLFGNEVSVIGVDHDQQMIQQARSATDHKTNVSFLQSEVNILPFQDDFMSGLRAERLFQHLADPDPVFKEGYRVLKTGQPFVIVETDWSSISIYNADHHIEKKINDYLTKTKVVNGFAAKKLGINLEQNHFRNIRLEVHPLVTSSFQQACTYLWLDKIIDEMLAKEYLTTDQHDSFLNELKEADDKGYFACSLNVVILSCIK